MTDSKEAQELLARAPAFAELGGRSLKKLVALCVPRSYSAGDTIIEEGDTGLGLLVITQGTAEVFKGHGEDRVRLATLGRGDIVGEQSLIDDQPRSASVIAREETNCLLMTRTGFQDLVKREPEIAWCFVPLLSARLRQLQERVQTSEHSSIDEAEIHTTEAALADDDDSPALTPLVTLPHAMARAGLAMMRSSVDLCTSFLDTVAQETGVDNNVEPVEVVRKLPTGIAKGIGSAAEEAERVPERLLRTFRHHLRRS
ncbi:MAG: cyclic nucleotide-binding domain-containing protein [bacterium]|nr:cyclic nucleotide-binding domain-containing protein [bacterium]